MTIIRDSAETATDAQTWLQVAQATGAKFDDYIAETSPAGMQQDLSYVTQLAQEEILASIEGGDEEDDAYPASLGNTLPITAQFQQQVYALGQSLGLPVINMSFGAGWTAANNWQGDYSAVGNLSAYANYANAHTYPGPGQLPGEEIQAMNGLAGMAASSEPVITAEIGWSAADFSEQTIAKYVLDAAMDGLLDGDAGMYFYGLYDDGSGDWGLFNADGTPRPAATALHNLTTLLSDTDANAATFTPGSLNYTLSGTETGDNSVLIEKSDGSFWIGLWNETEAANSPHTITVNLGEDAATVIEYDPLTGTTRSRRGPTCRRSRYRCRIIPCWWKSFQRLRASVPHCPRRHLPPPGRSSPCRAPKRAAGATIAVTGVSVADAFAASNPGTMALNLSAGSGTIGMTDASGAIVAGSGAQSMSISGTFAQITADLANLSYTAADNDRQRHHQRQYLGSGGLNSTASINVSVTPARTGPVITAPSTESVTAGATIAITGVSVAMRSPPATPAQWP